MGQRHPPAYCRRCDATVPTRRPWGGWRTAWRVWIGGAVALFAALPFFVWDPCLAQPSVMVYLAAGGLLWGQRRRRPICLRCSLELDEVVPRARGRS